MNLPIDRKSVTIAASVLVAALLVSLVAAWWSFRSRERRFATPVAPAAAPASPTGPVSPLTGLPLASATSSRPFAVMVEEHLDARPLSGVSRASLVFEAPVEGGITRLMAVFEDGATVPEIGPVRSARPYYLDWADELGAVYAHVGGSPEALTRIKAVGTRDLNQFFWGEYFWRSAARYAPHNVYTSSTLLTAARTVRGWDDAWTIEPWRFSTSTGAAATSTTIGIPFSSDGYAVRWRWDPALRRWLRSLGRIAAEDRDGRLQEAANVAVAFVDAKTLDAVGRLRIGTVGSGRAMLLRDGRASEGTWRKPSRTERLRFYEPDGEESVWTPGTTWIEIVPQEIAVSIIQ